MAFYMCRSCSEAIADALYNEKPGAAAAKDSVASIEALVEKGRQAEARGELLNEVAPEPEAAAESQTEDDKVAG
jgi:hypothetical protein